MSAEADVRARPVLVTGAGGFLGANLVWALREHGFAVRALVRRPPKGPQWQGLDGVECVRGDVCNLRSVGAAVTGVGAVIHNAACTALTPRPWRDAFRINVEGTRLVCDAALREGVRRLVFTSSVSTVAAGTAAAPADEDSPYNLGHIPSAYYTSKRLAERVVAEHHARGLEAVTLCPVLLFGPRDGRPTTNTLLLSSARSPLAVLPPGGINVLDVREAALAHVRALWLGVPGQRYLLAGPYRAYAELAGAARRIAGRRDRVFTLPGWTRGPGTLALALTAGVLQRIPNSLAVPSFRYGFVAFHVSGARADAAFDLTHRAPEETIFDALHWFQSTGLAPWLRSRRLVRVDPSRLPLHELA
jgi:dihydroflavonol-4-reductase